MKYQEVTNDSPHISAYHSHKSVHVSRMRLSKRTLMLESIKVFEDELVKRGALPRGEFYPLWFTAENERNTFLWRRGESLDCADKYEFWFNVPVLIDKRLGNCSSSHLPALFSPPSTNLPDNVTAARSGEQTYLEELKRQFIRAGSHIHVISLVTRLAYEEVEAETPERTLVVLPHP